MTKSSALVVLLLNSLVSVAWGFGNKCCLCDGCTPATTPQEYSIITQPYGLTSCGALDFQLLLDTVIVDGSATCTQVQNEFRDCCCNAVYDSCNLIDPEPWEDPALAFPAGSYPNCNICESGLFPGNPNTITLIAYLPGTPTCEDLYYMGITGNIPGGVCGPLQSFMRIPCGCLNGQPAPGPPGPLPAPAPAPSPPGPAVFMGPKTYQATAKDNLRIGVQEITRGGGTQ